MANTIEPKRPIVIVKSLPPIALLSCSIVASAASNGVAVPPPPSAIAQELAPPPPPAPLRVEPAPRSTARPTYKVNQARSATPRNQARWMQRILGAYPSRAQREGIEGSVYIRMTVTPQGRGTDCQIVSSSGSDLLDRAACRSAARYARFDPALDQAGTPTTGTFLMRVSYQLPESTPAPEQQSLADANAEYLEWVQNRRDPMKVSEDEEIQAAYETALAWLDEAANLTQAMNGGGSAVIMRGFIDERRLTAQTLEALNAGSIKPNLLLTEPAETLVEAIQVVRTGLLSGVPKHCVMVLQTQRSLSATELNKHVAEAIEGAPYFAPDFALNEECQENKPWDEGTTNGEIFDWDGQVAFLAGGPAEAVRVDESLSCEGLENISEGQFTLTPFAIFNTEFYTNLSPASGVSSSYNIRTFSDASRWFIHGVERSDGIGLRRIELVFDPEIAGSDNDISALFMVLDNREAEEFCVVVRLEQNTSTFQRVTRIPKAGRKLHWDYVSDGSAWLRTPELREFGQAAGPEFRTLVSVATSSANEVPD